MFLGRVEWHPKIWVKPQVVPEKRVTDDRRVTACAVVIRFFQVRNLETD